MSIRLKIKITKGILQKSYLCGTQNIPNKTYHIMENCAFALAVRDIWPKAIVAHEFIAPFEPEKTIDQEQTKTLGAISFKNEGELYRDHITFPITKDMSNYISWFDHASPEDRFDSDEREFELEVPDWCIEQINIDDILNSPTLELVADYRETPQLQKV